MAVVRAGPRVVMAPSGIGSAGVGESQAKGRGENGGKKQFFHDVSSSCARGRGASRRPCEFIPRPVPSLWASCTCGTLRFELPGTVCFDDRRVASGDNPGVVENHFAADRSHAAHQGDDLGDFLRLG